MDKLLHLKKDLAKFGLSTNQTDIYLLLHRKGTQRISDIVRTLQIPRSSVYESLKGLLALGLAEEIIENSYKTLRAYPLTALAHSLDEQIQTLQQQTIELEHLQKTLDVLPATKSHIPTTVRYYKGRAGARQLLWNSLKAQSNIYVYSEWGRGQYVGIDFYKRFVSESHVRSLQEKVITNTMPSILDSIQKHAGSPVSRTKVETIRVIQPDRIFFKGDTLMYDNIYAQVYLKGEEIYGFEIESNDFTETQRSIFITVWEAAQPVTKYL